MLRAIVTIILLHNAYSYGVSPLYGYHLKVGVPRAQEVWKLGREGYSRIVGGSQVSKADAFPYQAGIIATLTSGWTSLCGGALVSNARILTAAHCWWDGESQSRSFTVVLGSLTICSGGTRRETKDVVLHPNWDPKLLRNDIAVVRIAVVSFSNTIQVIPLPAITDVNRDFSGFTGEVAGYGKTSDAQNSFPTTTALRQLSVKVLSNAVCQRSITFNIHGSHLCTSGEGGIGTCDGDSGGPLTVVHNNRRTLIGIISFGPGEGCQAALPSVYTRVTAFLTWIQSQL